MKSQSLLESLFETPGGRRIQVLEVADETEELASPTAADHAEDAALPIDSRTIDAIAEAVVRRMSDDVVRQIAREIVPQVAEELIQQRIRELENDET